MMKQILLAALVATATIAGAQTISTTEPEFSGMIVYADSTAAGQSLETTTLAIKTKGNASLYVTGIGKATSYGVVKGKTSSTAIRPAKVLRFVYKAESNTVNPKEVIQLVRFAAAKDGTRIMPIASAGTFTGASSNEIGYLDFTAKKYGASSYLISVNDLAPGEYGFSLGKESTYTIHMFTVQ